jgi:hypothetical protein
MEWAIWGGAILTLLGVAGLLWCVVMAVRARRRQLPDEQMKAMLQRVVMLNVAALGVSALGLMLVVFGVILA